MGADRKGRTYYDCKSFDGQSHKKRFAGHIPDPLVIFFQEAPVNPNIFVKPALLSVAVFPAALLQVKHCILAFDILRQELGDAVVQLYTGMEIVL